MRIRGGDDDNECNATHLLFWSYFVRCERKSILFEFIGGFVVLCEVVSKEMVSVGFHGSENGTVE